MRRKDSQWLRYQIFLTVFPTDYYMRIFHFQLKKDSISRLLGATEPVRPHWWRWWFTRRIIPMTEPSKRMQTAGLGMWRSFLRRIRISRFRCTTFWQNGLSETRQRRRDFARWWQRQTIWMLFSRNISGIWMNSKPWMGTTLRVISEDSWRWRAFRTRSIWRYPNCPGASLS